jgi:hypothetical protein
MARAVDSDTDSIVCGLCGDEADSGRIDPFDGGGMTYRPPGATARRRTVREHTR